MPCVCVCVCNRVTHLSDRLYLLLYNQGLKSLLQSSSMTSRSPSEKAVGYVYCFLTSYLDHSLGLIPSNVLHFQLEDGERFAPRPDLRPRQIHSSGGQCSLAGQVLAKTA